MIASVDKTIELFRRNFKEIPLSPAFQTPFQTLVAVMLSARTRDETTVKIALKLFETAPDPQSIINLSIEDLTRKIYGVSFHITKAKNLHKLSLMLLNNFNGNVPSTLEELTTLPGIGRKTANIVLARVFNIPAIGVDTHVHRVANVLGWVKTIKPEQTEKELMKLLPKELWAEINSLLVSIGQQYRTKEKLEIFLKSNNLI